MASFVRTGELLPGGVAVRQTTFFAGPNSTGTFAAVATPEPFGPRNAGHSALQASELKRMTTESRIRVSRFRAFLL
jgi:hypothetical protein